jgi:hypothetical protein
MDDEESASMALELIQLGYDPDKIRSLRGGSLRWEDLDYPLVGSAQD